MTAHRAVDDEQLGKFARRTRELQERLEKGVVPYDPVMAGLQDLLELESARPRMQGKDLLKAYRRVRGLIFIGPAEWEKACLGPKKENPLELKEGWCHKLALPVPRPIEIAKSVVKYCHTPEWNTTPIFWLTVPKIISPKFGEIPTTLIGQNRIWGVAHDELPGGLVRQDVFYSNYFVKPNYDWANEPATKEYEWAFGYEFPFFTTSKIWPDQQTAVQARKGLRLVSAPRDALMCNVVLAATGRRLRLTTYSRTTTIFDGGPLGVYSRRNGVIVSQGWDPGYRYDVVAASVRGVLEL